MKSKSIALAITFAAVAIALTAIKIPTFFYPGGFFRFSQIPVIIAFLVFGFRIGVSVGLLTLIGQIAVFPTSVNAIFIAYPMEFVSVFLIILGMLLAKKLMKTNASGRYDSVLKNPVVGLTLFAVLFRGGIMPFVDYGAVFHVLVPMFTSVTVQEAYVVGLIPSFVAYNVIVPLYAVPVAYGVAKSVSQSLKIHSANLDV